MQEGWHTSQLSRIKQRALATDLSGPKAFVESLTPQSILAVVDTEFDPFLSAAAPRLTFSLG